MMSHTVSYATTGKAQSVRSICQCLCIILAGNVLQDKLRQIVATMGQVASTNVDELVASRTEDGGLLPADATLPISAPRPSQARHEDAEAPPDPDAMSVEYLQANGAADAPAASNVDAGPSKPGEEDATPAAEALHDAADPAAGVVPRQG